MYKIQMTYIYFLLRGISAEKINPPEGFQTKEDAEKWIRNYLMKKPHLYYLRDEFRIVKIKSSRRFIVERIILISILLTLIGILFLFPEVFIDIVKVTVMILVWRRFLLKKGVIKINYSEDKTRKYKG